MPNCDICEEPLVVHFENSDEHELEEDVVPSGSKDVVHPDDVELGCGCHFHWYVATSLQSLNGILICQAMSTGRW